MSAGKTNGTKIKLRNINELLEEPKTVDKSKLSLTPQNVSPRTRLRAKQEREAAVKNETSSMESVEESKEKPNNSVKKRATDQEKENVKMMAATTSKKAKIRRDSSSSVEFVLQSPAEKTKLTSKLQAKTTIRKKKLPTNQKRIDAFFQSITKVNKTPPKEKIQPRGRKRLFTDGSNQTKKSKTSKKRNNPKVEQKPVENEIIDLCLSSDTEAEQADLKDFDLSNSKSMIKMTKIPDMTTIKLIHNKQASNNKRNRTNERKGKVTGTKKENPQKNDLRDEGTSLDGISIEQKSSSSSNSENFHEKPPKPCPPYKVVEGTTFAVDAFRYGKIASVTHYFLTHFHADHYTGLSKKFEMPIYMSALTARLVREFIGLDDRFIYELPLNETVLINSVEVTALDANHCPGAIIIVFKLENGRCILHTGDFRACHLMESEPIFWNNQIDTIYLDTTYLPTQYAFCTQHESIDRGKAIVEEFKKKHPYKRVLYICGSYVIGKEKFWSSIAQEFRFKVWTESNRRKALRAMQLPELESIQYVEDAEDADLHIIPLGKLNYLELYEYFQNFSKCYDIMLALRPSGWERNSRPRFSAQINIVGIEYSEHSSYNELERFVKFLKPNSVISTVPVGHNLFKTAEIPKRWYEYEKLEPQTRNHQPSITNYLKIIKPRAALEKKNLTKTSFIEKDKHDCLHKISPTQSTPMGCIGSIPSHADFDADAVDDWIH